MLPSTSTFLAILSISAILVEASHDIRNPRTNHKKHALTVVKRGPNGKKCRVKSSPVQISSSQISAAQPTSTKKAASTSTSPAPTTSKAPATSPTTSAAPSSSSSPASSGGSGGNSGGVISVVSPICGASGGQTTPSQTNGPNGKLSWLNCGVAAGGWSPPPVKASDLIVKELSAVIGSAPFNACAAYANLFNKYADINGLPAILLASIAMQESGCNPATMGGAGEQGLMQLTSDKCGGAPGGNCKDPEYNISTGAKYFADTLASNGGLILKTMGQYNGWFDGMTVGQATAAATTSCCRCQQNLDYLHQLFNGWLQGIDPYSENFGQYFNLARCN